ncbi:MAG: response regulator [Deltaproteobacteria bacterium]
MGRDRIRILFVDDEAAQRDRLRGILEPVRAEMDLAFAESGAEALDRMAQDPCDVIVSDLGMPGMDGPALLREVRKRHPQVVRIALAGPDLPGSGLRSVEVAHQCLSGPVDPDILREVLGRARAMHALVDNDTLKALIGGMRSIPSLPDVYHEMMREIESPDASLRRIGGIIARDIGMCARILQLANSAFFGTMHRIADPVQAVTHLGLEVIKALVISVHIFSRFEKEAAGGFSLDALWKHSFVVGASAFGISRAAGSDRAELDAAFVGGILHDVGKLILAVNLPQPYRAVRAVSGGEGVSLCEAERECFGATHAEVGAYLLGIWGIPREVVEAVGFHHDPGRPGVRRVTATVAVHVANGFEHADRADARPEETEAIDMAFLESAGLSGGIPAWKTACDAIAQTG